MIRYIVTAVVFGGLFFSQQVNGQSLYMSDQSLGIQGGFGYASNTASLSGTSVAFSYSLNRTVDFSVAYDRFTKPEFRGIHSDISGSIVFYPKKQWKNDPFNLEVFLTGSNSTAPNRTGFSAALGTAISTKMNISDYLSFFPKTGFMFVPFRPGSPSQYSAITVGTSFTIDIVSGVKFLVGPGYQYEFGEHTSNFVVMGGIVL